LILAPDTAAITGSAESAAVAAPAPTKLTKSLRFNVVLTPAILDEHHRRKASLPPTASIREGLGGGVEDPKAAQHEPIVSESRATRKLCCCACEVSFSETSVIHSKLTHYPRFPGYVCMRCRERRGASVDGDQSEGSELLPRCRTLASVTYRMWR
jgi:hypothetical protein